MRVHFAIGMVAAVFAVLLVGPGYANPGFNVPVRITDNTCTLDYSRVTGGYSTIVFGIFNNGTVAHGFDIGGPYLSGLIRPGQEKTIVAHFRPGGYKWACVSRHNTVKRGVLTIA